MNDEDIKKEKEVFDTIDKNKDGYITVKELQEITKDTLSEIDIKNILMSVDLDKNGAINYSEFIAATMNELITKDANKMEAAFNYFDKDKNGVIDREDLKQLLRLNTEMSFDDQVIDEVVDEWDYNGDGKIDISEFYKWMSLKDL